MEKSKQKKIIRKHYELNRDISDEELEAEIVSLERKKLKGNLDDMDSLLAAKLEII